MRSGKNKEPVRSRFLGMAAIINAHAERAFLSMVSCEEFEEVDAIFTLSERFKSPYVGEQLGAKPENTIA